MPCSLKLPYSTSMTFGEKITKQYKTPLVPSSGQMEAQYVFTMWISSAYMTPTKAQGVNVIFLTSVQNIQAVIGSVN